MQCIKCGGLTYCGNGVCYICYHMQRGWDELLEYIKPHDDQTTAKQALDCIKDLGEPIHQSPEMKKILQDLTEECY